MSKFTPDPTTYMTNSRSSTTPKGRSCIIEIKGSSAFGFLVVAIDPITRIKCPGLMPPQAPWNNYPSEDDIYQAEQNAMMKLDKYYDGVYLIPRSKD
jgi:hypothetical protein